MTDESEEPDHDVEALMERLDEKEQRIEALESDLEEKEEQITEVKRAYASALADGDSLLDEDDFVERFEVAELREKVEERDADLVGTQPEPDVQSGGGEEAEASETEPEQPEEVAELQARAEKWRRNGNEAAAEALEERAEALGGD